MLLNVFLRIIFPFKGEILNHEAHGNPLKVTEVSAKIENHECYISNSKLGIFKLMKAQDSPI